MMRPVGENLRIYLHRAPIDLRRSGNGLAALTREVLKEDRRPPVLSSTRL